MTRYGRKGASSRIRHLDLIPGLKEAGFDFTVLPLLDNRAVERFYAGQPRLKGPLALSYFKRISTLLSGMARYDLIWIEKEALPWLPWTLERLAYRLGGCATVVDFDDNWHAHYEQQRWGFVRRMGTEKFPKLLQRADAVTAANPVLGLTLERLGGRPVDVIFNGVDLERYARAASISRDTSQEPQCVTAGPKPMRIGWIGTPTTARQHLAFAAPLLNQLKADGIGETILIGAGEAVPELEAQRLDWSEETEVENIGRFDVGIMPLPGSVFDQGKSGWKLVQCMAGGRPVVASSVGFNSELVVEGHNGFLVSDLDQFDQRLRQLASDHELRWRMGEAAQASLRARYSMDVTVKRTADVFRRAMAMSSARSTGTPRGR
ncbi:MAG: glycosyltransferase [Verrucomicrobiae bacterium]|nr:glycosyltransferase [Verrucomicrobiae bacterium]